MIIDILIVWGLTSAVFYGMRGLNESLAFSDRNKKGRIKTNLNLIALIGNTYELIINYDWKNKLKPQSPIDKEIAEEEKEIEELERQKEKINHLHRLKRRKEELFKQVGGDS